jgi:hypothetical protein
MRPAARQFVNNYVPEVRRTFAFEMTLKRAHMREGDSQLLRPPAISGRKRSRTPHHALVLLSSGGGLLRLT